MDKDVKREKSRSEKATSSKEKERERKKSCQQQIKCLPLGLRLVTRFAAFDELKILSMKPQSSSQQNFEREIVRGDHRGCEQTDEKSITNTTGSQVLLQRLMLLMSKEGERIGMDGRVKDSKTREEEEQKSGMMTPLALTASTCTGLFVHCFPLVLVSSSR